MVLRRNSGDAAGVRDLSFMPLCDAIKAERERNAGASDELAGGGGAHGAAREALTTAQIEDLAWWLATRLYDDAFDVFYTAHIKRNFEHQCAATPPAPPSGLQSLATDGAPRSRVLAPPRPWRSCTQRGIDPQQPEDKVRRLIREDFKTRNLDTKVSAMASHLAKLFASDACHGANVAEFQNAKRLLNALVKQDRLPAQTGLEGLELLKLAWMEHDVAVFLGRRYQALSRLLYALYLILGLTIITLSVLNTQGHALPTKWFWEELGGDGANATPSGEAAAPRRLAEGGGAWHTTLQHPIFALSLAGSLVLSVQAYYNPAQRAVPRSGHRPWASSLRLDLLLTRARGPVLG